MTKTRFKIAVALLTFLGGVTIYAMIKEDMSFAGESLAAIMVIAPAYILGDSFRKSDK